MSSGGGGIYKRGEALEGIRGGTEGMALKRRARGYTAGIPRNGGNNESQSGRHSHRKPKSSAGWRNTPAFIV